MKRNENSPQQIMVNYVVNMHCGELFDRHPILSMTTYCAPVFF